MDRARRGGDGSGLRRIFRGIGSRLSEELWGFVVFKFGRRFWGFGRVGIALFRRVGGGVGGSFG